MFSSGANYSKLKTNLKLAINRLKLIEKKKTELALKCRKEIADYLSSYKTERAKIRVEHIIREDYVVEAMELIEMYCDLLLSRFGLIQQMKMLDPGIEEAISSILWACPRLQTDIPELKVISEQLAIKYGKPYAKSCLTNSNNTVNCNLMSRLSIHAPPSQLVENYLVAIAKSHNIPYEAEFFSANEETNQFSDLSDFLNFNSDHKKPPSGGSGYSGGGNIVNTPYNQNTCPQFLPKPFNYPVLVKDQAERPPSVPPPPYSSFDHGALLQPSKRQQPAENPNFSKVSYNPVPKPPRGGAQNHDCIPILPDVPNFELSSVEKQDDLSFDDLSKRFQDLKKKK